MEVAAGTEVAPEIKKADIIGWALGLATFVLMLGALYAVFVYVPTDSMQGIVQRIFYFHVPAAWVAFLAFFVVFISSILFLLKGDSRWDTLAYSSAEIGVVFSTLVLITGSLWGRPIWGTWWTWDARLTSMLVLWLIYAAYLMLRSQASEGAQRARFAAILGIVGFIDVPIIHISVTWWRTLHPKPVVLRQGDFAGGLAPSMLVALGISFLAFTLLYILLLRTRLQIERMKLDLEGLKKGLRRA